MEYDGTNKGSVWLNYMRIRVELDVSKPLKRKENIKLANGLSKSMDFKYERLHLFYFICGMIDHTESFCDATFENNGDEIARE